MNQASAGRVRVAAVESGSGLVLAWTAASDSQSGLASCWVQYNDPALHGGWWNWLSCASPVSSATFYPVNSTDTYSFRSVAVDNAGNTAISVVPFSQYDTTPPQVSIADPVSERIYTVAPSISGTASDTGGSGLASLSLQLQGPAGYWNPNLGQAGQWVGSAAWFGASGFSAGSGTASWSCTSCAGAIGGQYGSYELTVQAVDGAGNTGQAWASFSLLNPTQTFTYDPLDRLTSAYGITYTYDSLGRPNGGTDQWGESLSYTLETGHVHAVASVSRQILMYNNTDYYTYDADGNMQTASLQSTGQSQTLSWDAENRLESVATSGGSTEQYAYDQDGGWAEKIVTVGSSSTYTFYVGPHYEVQVSGGQSTVTKYYYFGQQRVAEWGPVLVQGLGVYDELVYLHADDLGSTLAATDPWGNVVGTGDQPRYDAYGNDLYGTVGQLQAITDDDYTGEKLSGTGFYQMGARWYDPYIAQWIQPDTMVPDPTDPQTLNRYVYADNNPLRYTDPSGHDVGCPGCDASDAGILGELAGTSGSEAAWNYFVSVFNSPALAWEGPGLPPNFRPEELAQEPASAPYVIGGVAVAAVAVAGLPEDSPVLPVAGAAVEALITEGAEGADEGTASAAEASQSANDPAAIRPAYESAVRGLASVADDMRSAGRPAEEIARTLWQQRRTLGILYKDMTPPDLLEQIYQRNLERYGDPLGPTIEYLLNQGKSWEDIIESACRPGGQDIIPKLLGQ
ncbi:MAG: RHS repeat domain-containing protein [Streptosporangiaceae bacterium]